MLLRWLFRNSLPVDALRVALSCALPVVASGQAVTPVERTRAHVMLKQVRQEIERSYFDSTLHGVNLQTQFTALDDRIQHATSLGEMLAAVAQLPLVIKDSHTFFVPPQQTVRAEYGWDILAVGDSIYVGRVESGSDAEKQGVHPGDLVLAMNGYQPTRQNQWMLFYLYHVLRPQPELHVVVRAPGGQPRQLDLAARVRQNPRILDLTGRDGGSDIERLIRDEEREERERRAVLVNVDDSVLLWRLPTFDVSFREIDEARKAARHHSALVLDLRDDQGGGVEQLLAITRALSRNEVTLGTQQERTRVKPLVAKAGGGDAFNGRVIVLVDSRSASASEFLARIVQLTHRGIVLGDRTAGAVMRGRFHFLKQGMETAVFYGVSVTEADLVMTDGGRLEKVGVVPDTALLPTAEDLAAKRDPVLARALTLLGHPIDARTAGAILKDQ